MKPERTRTRKYFLFFFVIFLVIYFLFPSSSSLEIPVVNENQKTDTHLSNDHEVHQKEDTFTSPSKPGNYAFCTLLHTEIGNRKEGYVASVLVMAASLRLMQSKYKLIVLVVGKQSDYVNDALSSCTNCIARPVDSIPLPPNLRLGSEWVQDKWTKAFNKLWIWNLTEYDRILWMDADIFPADNIDDVFDFKITGDILMSRNWCGKCCQVYKGAYEYGNSGIILLKPSLRIFELLKSKIAVDRVPDQRLIQHYLKFDVLPDIYGPYATESLVSCCPGKKEMVPDDKAKVVHNIEKPWLIPFQPYNGSYSLGWEKKKFPCGYRFLLRWYELYDRYVADYVKLENQNLEPRAI